MKKLIKIAIVSVVICMLCISFYVSKNTKHLCYGTITELPKRTVGLVLGTAKYTDSSLNLYYKYRLEAAVSLYKSGKIDCILVSGDNSKKDYNEPLEFKKDLVKQGIPENKIYLDYAGFSTLDSVLRAKEIFGLSQFTIISQKFHNERALFIDKQYK